MFLCKNCNVKADAYHLLKTINGELHRSITEGFYRWYILFGPINTEREKRIRNRRDELKAQKWRNPFKPVLIRNVLYPVYNSKKFVGNERSDEWVS